MARRPIGSPPSYRLHKQSGQAVVSLPLGNGRYRDVLLGVHGSEESHQEYARVLAEWKSAGCVLPPKCPARQELSVNEFVEQFWEYAKGHYRDRTTGQPTTELSDIRYSLKPLRELYGLTAVGSFGPRALKTIRQRMIDDGLARSTVNHRIARIVRAFKWGVENELVPAMLLVALKAVRGLQAGRTTAPETEPVRPVSDAVVDATLPHLNTTVRAMVRFQRLTGARPGEVCQLRACDIEMGGRVWLYRPAKHKTAYRGRVRVIAIGPKAQEIIKPFLTLDMKGYLFSPANAMQEFRVARRTARKTKVQPSQAYRKKANPKKRPGERYVRRSYTHAITLACDQAFPPPGELARRKVDAKNGGWRWEKLAEWRARLGPEGWDQLKHWREQHRWFPHQLRHSLATEVRKQFGLEAAQVSLGHAQANVTEIYAERDLTLATKVAEAIG